MTQEIRARPSSPWAVSDARRTRAWTSMFKMPTPSWGIEGRPVVGEARPAAWRGRTWPETLAHSARRRDLGYRMARVARLGPSGGRKAGPKSVVAGGFGGGA